VPIRFKRQNFEKAETMDIRLFDTEIMAHQLAFDYDESGWFWRLFIETDENRDILRLVLAQITEAGSTKNAFTIPLTGSVSLASPVKTTRREAAQVERIQLGVKKSSDKKVVEYGNNQQ
jgi:hypothetical protein